MVDRKKFDSGEITINIPTAMLFMRFSVSSTGPYGCDTSPGLGFNVERYPTADSDWTNGVISRDDAKRLHALIGRLLEAYPADPSKPGLRFENLEPTP